MSSLPLPVPQILLLSIVASAILIYAPFTLVAFARYQLGPEARATPRATLEQLPPYAQRATWAHQNSFETFMVYTAAALMAYVTGQESQTVAWAAIAFVLARAFYSVFYIGNVPVGRSLMFGIGTTAIATLFIQSLSTQVVS